MVFNSPRFPTEKESNKLPINTQMTNDSNSFNGEVLTSTPDTLTRSELLRRSVPNQRQEDSVLKMDAEALKGQRNTALQKSNRSRENSAQIFPLDQSGRFFEQKKHVVQAKN